MLFKLANLGYRTAKRVVITLAGGTVVLIGVAMLVLPGPAVVVIPVGLTILGLEWAWARRILRTIKETGSAALSKVGLANEESKAGKVGLPGEESTGGDSSSFTTPAPPANDT